MKMIILVVSAFVVFLSGIPANASIVISEFLADPAPGLSGDANGDGVSSSIQDEFIELFNFSFEPIEISGWALADAVKIRHIFPKGTVVDPYSFFVVFGGGMTTLANAQIASLSGGLGLNNTGDTIFLLDEQHREQQFYTYDGTANKDQSLTRMDMSDGRFYLHSDFPEAQGRLFSPGVFVNGQTVHSPVTTPEPESWFGFVLFLGIVVTRKVMQLTARF